MIPTTPTSPWGRRMAADRAEILAEVRRMSVDQRQLINKSIVEKALRDGEAVIRLKSELEAKHFRRNIISSKTYRKVAEQLKSSVCGCLVRVKLKQPKRQ